MEGAALQVGESGVGYLPDRQARVGVNVREWGTLAGGIAQSSRGHLEAE